MKKNPFIIPFILLLALTINLLSDKIIATSNHYSQIAKEVCFQNYRSSPLTPSKFNFNQEYKHLSKKVLIDLKCLPYGKREDGSVSYVNSWNAKRDFGGCRFHEGLDFMLKENTPGTKAIYSMTNGTVTNLGWLKLGGYRIGITSPTGIYYYYAHLDSYSKEIALNKSVTAGQFLGFMGNTGYGPEGTKEKFQVHLHLGIYVIIKNHQYSINPYPFIKKIDK